MRDGVKLFTAIYTPKDATQKYPILLERTPYSCWPYGADKFKPSVGPSDLFTKAGYIVAYQDVRGQEHSEGKWMEIRPIKDKKGPKDTDESTDAYDTIEWLIKNVANNNGRVGTWGISYPGFYVSAGMINAHPALKAASPQAPVSDWFHGDDVHHNGALFLAQEFDFDISFNRPESAGEFSKGTADSYKFFLEMGSLANAEPKYFKGGNPWWSEMLTHPNYDDFWKDRNILTRLKGIRLAVMTVGGWFDAEDLYGALNVYKSIEKMNPGASNRLVMGPWLHGGWGGGDGDTLGDARFGQKTGEYYRQNIELAFFEYYLKDKGDGKLAEATVFETGANRWRQFDEWPPKAAKAKKLYLRAEGKIAFDPPTDKDGAEYEEYVSDPAKPVPFIAAALPETPGDYMARNQRFAASRSDVKVFISEPLTDDLTLAGPITSRLTVSTSGTDSDFVVKLIDVFPDDAGDQAGFQMMLRGEPMRAKFRNSFEKPEAMTPNKPEKVEFVMPDVMHTIKKGHRIMVQIQSSWFPLVDRNPQVFLPNIAAAKDSDFQKATQRIYLTPKNPSLITVSVLPQ